MSFSFLGVPPPNSPDECGTLTKQIIRACILRGVTLQGGSGTTINITNLINIVNNFLNRCANYPLQLDGTAAQCIEIAPGFCGSILQNINGAWGIYRSPGITEITIGAGGSGIAPGANFPTVAAALGAPATPTNCRFLRITSDVTDGALVLPANTLIYIDPGVTWTLTGQITITGDFALWGANPTPSSAIVYDNLGSIPLITGAGSALIQNLHVIHNSGNNEPIISPTIASRIKHVVFDVAATTGSAVADTLGPFVDMTLDHVTINGNGASRPLIANQNTSVFRSSNLEFTGILNTAMLADVATNEWNGIRNRATPPAPGTIDFTIGGMISDFQDVANTANITLGADAEMNNITVNTLLIAVVNNRVMVNNAVCGTISLPSPSNIQFDNVTTNSITLNQFNLGTNCQINNFQVITAVATITSTFLGSPQLSNIVLPANWTVVSGPTSQTIQLSNIQLTGVFSFNVANPGVPVSSLSLHGMRCTGFTFGGATTDSGVLLASDVLVNGNFAVFVGRGALLEPEGSVYMSNFRITGTYTHTQSTSGKYSNGVILGTATWVGPPGINAPTRQQWDNIEFQGDMVVDSDNNMFTNITALHTGIATSRNLTISGNENAFHGLSTWRLSQFGSQSGTITISGQNNIGTSWNLTGGSLVVTTTGTATMLTGIRITGNIRATAGAQLFQIFGSQCKLSNIVLGGPVNLNFADFTQNGFGAFQDGSYNVFLGDPAGGTASLQVENFSLYPKRGQVIAAGVGDISPGPAAPANMLAQIHAITSSFVNMRYWYYPGGVYAPVLGPLIASLNPVVTISGTCSQCQFQNMQIGFGQETPGATALTSIGTLQVVAPGSDNSFQNITAVTYTVTQNNANFLGVNGWVFATLTPPGFNSTGSGTITNQMNFPATGSNITFSGLNSSICNSIIGGGAAGVPVFGLTFVATADRFLSSGNQFLAGPTSISNPGGFTAGLEPLFVGNANSGPANVAPYNVAGTGNY